MRRFSVILCSRNRASQVSKCLASLNLAPLAALDGELVLVDSASTDTTLDVFHRFKAENSQIPCKVLTTNEPGLSIARNAGVKNSSGGVLVFLDDDVYLGDEYISKVLALLEDPSSYIDFVSGRILLFDPTDSRYGCKFGTRYWEAGPGSTVRPGQFQGTNFCATREVYERVGGFDDELGAGKQFRCEDVDFVARALSAGFRGAYDPQLEVFHHHGRKNGEETRDLDRQNLYAAGAFYSKMTISSQAYKLPAVWFSCASAARRLIPRRTKLAPGWSAMREFWQGFKDYREARGNNG